MEKIYDTKKKRNLILGIMIVLGLVVSVCSYKVITPDSKENLPEAFTID